MGNFILAAEKQKTVLCVERCERGLTRVAAAVARDLRAVTGARPCGIRVAGSSSPLSGACANADVVICAGIVGKGSWIDDAADEGLFDIADVIGKRECYCLRLCKVGGRPVVIVAGSDLLGAEYGLLRLSALAGVSPWHYWADVVPARTGCVAIDEAALNTVSKEPAIRLRGFFMNDEWPSLGGWVHETFGGFNELFYEKVFDLLLRLRGNFLWPAMWSAVFSEDGYAFPTASAELANELGIVMGTSHHEPLFRAGEEFSHTMTDSNDAGYGKDWSYYSNERGLYSFWEDSVVRNRGFVSLITVGMRGERDSKILGENATLADNIDLLKKTITDQKRILRDNGLGSAPKVLALYKEVEDYFYGDADTEGLQTWNGLDDVMLLLSDDNFGNTRTLPTEATMNRAAGWGLYYHFDYHGDPISYEWVGSTPITKAWEQLTMAHDYGIRDLWVANVGDLRPCELPLSYFLDLAFDYDEWSERNKTTEYLDHWVAQQFGGCSEDVQAKLAAILNGYTRLNGDRRPEATYAHTFSLSEEDEAQRELARARALAALVDEVEPLIPADRRDAFTGLVGFPARASANLREMMLLAGMHDFLYTNGAVYANAVRGRILACIERDKALEHVYNEEMADGKWRHMMSSKHVAFVNWNDEGSAYPAPQEIVPAQKQGMFVAAAGRAAATGEIALPIFSALEEGSESFFVFGTGSGRIDPVICSADKWIKLGIERIDDTAVRCEVDVDRAALSENVCGEISVFCAGENVIVRVEARFVDTKDIPDGTFVESRGVVSMEAEHFAASHEADGCAWQVIDSYGKSLSAVKCLPNRVSFAESADAPTLEYRFFIANAGEYTFTAVIAPTNNPHSGEGLRFAYSLDGGERAVVDTLPAGFAAGAVTDENWKRYVLDNARRVDTKLTLAAGLHTLRFMSCDPCIVLQKIELAQTPSTAFYGYRETFRK